MARPTNRTPASNVLAAQRFEPIQALPIQPIEKEQIIKSPSLTNGALIIELQRRWLALYTLDELQNEAIRRGLIPRR